MRDTQEMIDVAAKHGVTADIEVVGAEYVNTAMERLAKADVRYRFVIDIGNTLKSSEPPSEMIASGIGSSSAASCCLSQTYDEQSNISCQ